MDRVWVHNPLSSERHTTSPTRIVHLFCLSSLSLLPLRDRVQQVQVRVVFGAEKERKTGKVWRKEAKRLDSAIDYRAYCRQDKTTKRF
jgi:hypothetical protein